jgi:hypothetical protein
MYINYLGGKTNYKKWVQVFYLTEFAKLNGWLPDDKRLDSYLELDEGCYVVPVLWGYNIIEVKL